MLPITFRFCKNIFHRCALVLGRRCVCPSYHVVSISFELFTPKNSFASATEFIVASQVSHLSPSSAIREWGRLLHGTAKVRFRSNRTCKSQLKAKLDQGDEDWLLGDELARKKSVISLHPFIFSTNSCTVLLKCFRMTVHLLLIPQKRSLVNCDNSWSLCQTVVCQPASRRPSPNFIFELVSFCHALNPSCLPTFPLCPSFHSTILSI